MDNKDMDEKILHKDKLPSEMTIEELLLQASQKSASNNSDDLRVEVVSETSKPNPLTHEDFNWNVHEFPKPKKIETVEFNWRTGEEIRRRNALGENHLTRNVDLDTDARMQQLEKYLVFNQEKEEFQNYLDHEYDKIKARPRNTAPFVQLYTANLDQEAMEKEDEIEVSVAELELPIAEPELPVAEPELAAIVTPEKATDKKTDMEQAVAAFLADSDSNREESTVKKNGCLLRLVVAILIGIVIGEASILIVQYGFPNSLAASYVNNAQSIVTDYTSTSWDQINKWIDSIAGQKDQAGITEPNGTEPDPANSPSTDQTNEPAQQEQPAAPTPAEVAPMADKAALVASQLKYNKNILDVAANEDLGFQAGKDYGINDLNQSTPIANNIWTGTTNQDAVYIDAAVVRTLISFDSKWIDYVNGVDKAVIDMTKEDSPAYRNAVSYTKVGKVEETFVKLEIGEIRQGKSGFYVWTRESIKISEGGKLTSKDYRWIYYIEPVAWTMKVVDYYRY